MSDPYQAIYDAVRSRSMTLGERIAHVGGRTNAASYIEFGSGMVHGGDISQAAESALREAFGNADHVIRCAMQDVAVSFAEHARPSAVYRPTVERDGNQWCALYGANLMQGVVGFGDSPELAMADFDANWRKKVGTPEGGA